MHGILTQINDSLHRFGEGPAIRRTKLTGALGIEVVREHLINEGIPVSPRDVFIRGVPSELDLLIPAADAKPEHDLIYEPKDAKAVLEIKFSGVYDRQVIPRLRDCFAFIKSKCPGVYCACVVIRERKGFSFAADEKDLRDPVFTLHWYSGTRENVEETGDWRKLVDELRKRSSSGGHAVGGRASAG